MYLKIEDDMARALLTKWAILDKVSLLTTLSNAIAEYLDFPLEEDLGGISDLSEFRLNPLQVQVAGKWDPPDIVGPALGLPSRAPQYHPEHTFIYTGSWLTGASFVIDAELGLRLTEKADSEKLTPAELAEKVLKVYEIRRQS